MCFKTATQPSQYKPLQQIKNILRWSSTESGMTASSAVTPRTQRIVGYWLMGCCVMVAGSVVIGQYSTVCV